MSQPSAEGEIVSHSVIPVGGKYNLLGLTSSPSEADRGSSVNPSLHEKENIRAPRGCQYFEIEPTRLPADG